MNTKVSVIMGIYNCAETLPQALDSLLQQTYQDFQLILCDDGSSDDTFSVARAYQDRYPQQIQLFRNEENCGLNITLNRCLEKAQGEYIARMDGDDISLPTRFEKEVAFLDAHPEYAFVGCSVIYFDEKGDFRIGAHEGDPGKKSLSKSSPFCHAACIVRKEAYDAVNGYSLKKSRFRVEDWDLWVRMYAHGYRGYNLPEPLYKVRDDRQAYRRRKFKYRLHEAAVSISAVVSLRLNPLMFVYCLRPILVGLLPRPVYQYLHKRKRGL